MSKIKKPQEGQELIKEKIDFTSLILPILIVAFFLTIIIVAMNYNNLTDSSQSTNTQTSDTNNTSANISDLQIEDLKVGEGRELKAGDTATFHYVGTLKSNGNKFDSSRDRGQPFSTQIGVGQVIPGWDQGIPGMKIGGVRKLTIPYDLAYGEEGVGQDIPPKSDLVFEVELLEIQ
jgi:FKBP-type peptidyl-prolyl cis-trans isomerase